MPVHFLSLSKVESIPVCGFECPAASFAAQYFPAASLEIPGGQFRNPRRPDRFPPTDFEMAGGHLTSRQPVFKFSPASLVPTLRVS